METETDASGTPRILVGGVGYRLLRDLSFGPLLIERLAAETWPEGVELEDLSYGPVGVMHNFDARPPYDRIVLVGAVKRGRPAGDVFRYAWRRQLPDPDEIQARVAEAVTGVISLDNLLIITTYFDKLPRDVVVIEVEALDEDWGEELSAEMEAAVPRVTEEIRKSIAGLRPS
ncbi:MAG: hydrogenase maturation protease [Acidobacteriota bacterium]|nr:hydrogenase maturation protease [Acidobacteriota bacterium]